MTVSIALATFNGEQFLQEQLDSLALQTRLPDELVICDDVSSDRTVEIVRAFSRTAPFLVRLELNKEQLGYRRNFMKAAALCTSELVSFCDQDDVWKHDKLSTVLPVFDDPEVALVYHNATLVDSHLNAIGTFFPPGLNQAQAPDRGRPWWNPNGFSQTFRHDLLLFSDWRERVGSCEHDNTPLAHDQWMMFLAWSLGKIVYLPTQAVLYRQHGNNLYGKRPVRFRERIRYVSEERSGSYVQMADVSRRFASMLSAIGSGEVSPITQRANESASDLLQLAGFYDDRAMAVGAKSLLSRAAAFDRLRRAGLYTDQATWSFGRKAFVKDLMLGVLPGKFASSMRPSGSAGDVIVSRRSRELGSEPVRVPHPAASEKVGASQDSCKA